MYYIFFLFLRMKNHIKLFFTFSVFFSTRSLPFRSRLFVGALPVSFPALGGIKNGLLETNIGYRSVGPHGPAWLMVTRMCLRNFLFRLLDQIILFTSRLCVLSSRSTTCDLRILCRPNAFLCWLRRIRRSGCLSGAGSDHCDVIDRCYIAGLCCFWHSSCSIWYWWVSDSISWTKETYLALTQESWKTKILRLAQVSLITIRLNIYIPSF